MIEQESKFNINTADAPLLQQVLTTMGVDASNISVVSDSIQDWIDPDDATRPAGAESDYYQGLMPPYYAKNAPIDDIEELQLIKGVTPLMFKGGSVADPNARSSITTRLRQRAGPGTGLSVRPARCVHAVFQRQGQRQHRRQQCAVLHSRHGRHVGGRTS